MKKPSQKNLRERLIAFEEEGTQVAAARAIYVPYRTYKNWRNGASPIRGILRALIEAKEEVKALRKKTGL